MRVRATEVFLDWMEGLRDRAVRARVQVRIDRLIHGNPGEHRRLTNGVWELRIDFGPGYRVYFTRRGEDWIVLLAGGDKQTQTKDLRRAIQLAKDLKED